MADLPETRPLSGVSKAHWHSLPQSTVPIRTTAPLLRCGSLRPNGFLRRGNCLPCSTLPSHRGSHSIDIGLQLPGRPAGDISGCIGHKEISETRRAAHIAVPGLYPSESSDYPQSREIRIYAACLE